MCGSDDHTDSVYNLQALSSSFEYETGALLKVCFEEISRTLSWLVAHFGDFWMFRWKTTLAFGEHSSGKINITQYNLSESFHSN